MRVTVKIGDIEVTIKRPGFREGNMAAQDRATLSEQVIPTLKEATDKAKELYNLKSLSNEPSENNNV